MIRLDLSLACALGAIALAASANADLLPYGILNDEQPSIVYTPDTGEVAVDAPASTELTSVTIVSAAAIFTEDPAHNLYGEFVYDGDDRISSMTFGGSFGPASFGNVAQSGLSEFFVRNDLAVSGSLSGGAIFSSPDDLTVDLCTPLILLSLVEACDDVTVRENTVDLVYMHELFPGDANRDFAFDQLDIVHVQQAGKYLTGQRATWGEGDWNGGPGGYPGEPPAGDGLFDQLDIVAAQQAGLYLKGPYATLSLPVADAELVSIPVPEPSSLLLLGLGMLALTCRGMASLSKQQRVPA